MIVTLDTTSLYQVFKLPSLVRHFIEHKSINNNIGFVDFLAMHYWGEDLNDNDDEQDMQLPFKKIDLHQSGFLYVPAANYYTVHQISWQHKPDYGPDRSQIHFNTHLGSLFRPPRA